MGIGENQGLKSKNQIFIPLMEFIATYKHCVSSNLPRFSQKSVFEQIWWKNQSSPISKQFMGFVHIFKWIPIQLYKFPKYMRIVL
jgi:hypothetical protein